MTSSAFIFPDPAVTPEFTATNGITYIYDSADSKWTVKNSGINIQYIPTTGGTINADGGTSSVSGNLTIQDKAAGGAGRLYVKDKDGNTNLKIYPSGTLETTSIKVENTSLFKGKSTFQAANLNDFTAGVVLDTINNTSTLWNRSQPGIFQFKTNDTPGGGTAAVFIDGASNSPAFTVAIGSPGFSLERVFSCSYSSTYGKRVYVYPNWGQGYANAADLPDQTPVTLGYLRAQGLVTTASTTAASSPVDPSGVEHGDISFQTDVTVPSQMTLSADLSGGTGFTLKGKTVADPSNHNAELFKTTHYTTADEALVEYFGDVHSSTSAIQTKASVASKVAELQVKIRTAVDASTDYTTLKAALLAAL